MIDIDQLHGEIWYQVAYTMALLEGDKQKSKEVYKELSDKIHEILVSRVELPVGMPNEPTSCELNNTIGALQTAKRWALVGFDEWNTVTGYVPENTGYYFEITSLIEDAVEYGFGVAHNQNLKTIRQRIKDGENGLEKIKRATDE